MNSIAGMLLRVLKGKPAFGAYFCEGWELRITQRCLVDDLKRPADSDFADLMNIGIIQTFVRQRSDRIEGTRKVEPLQHGDEVWIFGKGHNERGATAFDEVNRIVWLVSYHPMHRSGTDDDYIPVAKQLDAEDRLMPTTEDYERYFAEHSEVLAKAIMVQAPLILRAARGFGGVYETVIGHSWGARIAVEVDVDLETVTVVFDLESTPYNQIPAILAAFFPDSDWYDVHELKARKLDSEKEIGFAHLHEIDDLEIEVNEEGQ